MTTIKTGKLFTSGFWEAFNSMMAVKTFSPATKVRMVGLKKFLVEKYNDTNEVFQSIQKDYGQEASKSPEAEQKCQELRDLDINMGDFSDLFKEAELAEHLTAAQLYELSDFIKE